MSIFIIEAKFCSQSKRQGLATGNPKPKYGGFERFKEVFVTTYRTFEKDQEQFTR